MSRCVSAGFLLYQLWMHPKTVEMFYRRGYTASVHQISYLVLLMTRLKPVVPLPVSQRSSEDKMMWDWLYCVDPKAYQCVPAARIVFPSLARSLLTSVPSCR